MPTVGYTLTALVAYLLGSIPTGFLVGKARGIDIRKVGSGNIGATNVLRALGTPAGIFVLLADAVKGWVAVFLAAKWLCGWFCPAAGQQTLELFRICASLFAVMGHNYTCWLSFKGGKGIATSAGVLLALVPWSLVIILTIFVIVLALTRFVSLGSMCASFALPFAAWLTRESRTLVLVAGIMGALAIYKHKANIKRLLAGTESRFGRKQPTAAEALQKTR